MTSGTNMYRDRFGIEPLALRDAELAAPVAAILHRRSHRSFKPEKLAPDLLEALVACAQSAPSKSDLQQMSIILIDKPQARAVVMGDAPTDEWMRSAPHVAVFCADMRRGQRLCALRGHPHRNDNLDTFLNTSADAALASRSGATSARSSRRGASSGYRWKGSTSTPR